MYRGFAAGSRGASANPPKPTRMNSTAGGSMGGSWVCAIEDGAARARVPTGRGCLLCGPRKRRGALVRTVSYNAGAC